MLPAPPPAEYRSVEVVPSSRNRTFRPGDWEQDKYTLPVEVALASAMQFYYVPMSQPLWPFKGESTTRKREPSRHPGREGALILAGITAAQFFTLEALEPRFPAWRHFRGLVHTLAWNEIITSSFKLSVQRERPFHDKELAGGTLRKDDRKSFYSGHASHIFSVATYTSAMFREHAPEPWQGWAMTTGMYALAGWVASARAIDGQHHWSDVVVGALAGSAVAFKINFDVEAVFRSELSD